MNDIKYNLEIDPKTLSTLCYALGLAESVTEVERISEECKEAYNEIMEQAVDGK